MKGLGVATGWVARLNKRQKLAGERGAAKNECSQIARLRMATVPENQDKTIIIESVVQ